MAKSDMDTMRVSRQEEPRTAYDNIADVHESPNDVENREAAAAAGVKRASFIDYDVALDAYAARPDVEDLQHKNARNNPVDFDDADFMRSSTYDKSPFGDDYVGSEVGSGN